MKIAAVIQSMVLIILKIMVMAVKFLRPFGGPCEGIKKGKLLVFPSAWAKSQKPEPE
jgi:hypothetical protein